MIRRSIAVLSITASLSTAFVFCSPAQPVFSQDPIVEAESSESTDEQTDQETDPQESVPAEVAAKVEVVPENSDGRIGSRLSDILEATQWFDDSEVRVEDGVVFLSGVAGNETQREWAEKTAMRTSDVVAVVNRITVRAPPPRPFFDFAPAAKSLWLMLQGFFANLPLFLVAALVIGIGHVAAKIAAKVAHRAYAGQESKLLRQVVSSVAWTVVFLIAVSIALQISGLTKLASTLLGGTGLIGLALGFAFRDIAENFLASLLMSIQAPFGVGDLIEVDGITGFVRKVTTRATVLATFDGSQVQIPNATVYKGKITNFTATPLRRQNFKIGIGYADSASDAQNLIMKVIQDHPAVENEPAPAVLVESLGTSTVNLNCLYWFNQREHSGARVGSVLIRQSKQALLEAGISLPDEARELVFPTSVPVQLLQDLDLAQQPAEDAPPAEESSHTSGEGDLHSEDADVQRVMGDDEAGDSIV